MLLLLLTKWNTSNVPVTAVASQERDQGELQLVVDQGELQLDQLVQCVIVIIVGRDDASLVPRHTDLGIDELTQNCN